MKIRTLIMAGVIALASLFPLAGTAQATHACGWDGPCPHVEDVITIVCASKYGSILEKFGLCYW